MAKIDVLERGKLVDLGLRLMGDASPLPDGVRVVSGFDRSGHAIRTLTVSPQGDLIVAPSEFWGSGGNSDLFEYSGNMPAGTTVIGTVEGWKYAGVYIMVDGVRSNPTTAAPVLYVYPHIPSGGVYRHYVASLGYDGEPSVHVVPCLPVPMRIEITVAAGDSIQNARVFVRSVTPSALTRPFTNNMTVFAGRTFATGTYTIADRFRPVRDCEVIYTLTLDDKASTQSVGLAAFTYYGFSSAPIAASPSIFTNGEKAIMRVQTSSEIITAVNVRGGTGSATVSLLAEYRIR